MPPSDTPRHFREALRKFHADPDLIPMRASSATGLYSSLAALAGGGPFAVEHAAEQLDSRIKAFSENASARVGRRILLGIALGRRRPKYGEVGEFHTTMGRVFA